MLSEQRGKPVDSLSSGARYETDTLDTLFDSSWYFLRFLDPKNEKMFADPKLVARHMPVDVYVGGVEHAALHLYYARFFSYFLSDIGAARWEGGLEPFRHLVPQGIVKGKTYVDRDTGRYVRESDVDFSGSVPRVSSSCSTPGAPSVGTELGVDFEKMSKSKHNGLDPITVIEKDGIDLARLQLLDTASPRAPINWGEADLSGLKRWVDRMAWVVNTYVEGRRGLEQGYCIKSEKVQRQEEELREVYNYFVRNVGMTLEVLHLHNTSIARLQGLTNALRKVDPVVLANSVQAERCVYALVTMLQVFAPHTAAELFTALKDVPTIDFSPANRIDEQPWPEVDADAIIDLTLNVEGLSLEQLLARATSHEHADLMKWLRESDTVIKKATMDSRNGFFSSLSIEVLDSSGRPVSDDTLRKQLDVLSKARQKKVKEEKRKRKKAKN